MTKAAKCVPLSSPSLQPCALCIDYSFPISDFSTAVRESKLLCEKVNYFERKFLRGMLKLILRVNYLEVNYSSLKESKILRKKITERM